MFSCEFYEMFKNIFSHRTPVVAASVNQRENNDSSQSKESTTSKNTLVSPNFLVWKFYGKAQFLHSFGQFTRDYAETVPFYKISTAEN